MMIVEDCPNTVNDTILNIQGLLTGLEYASELRYIDDMLNILNALEKYCTNDCNSCGQETNVDDYENNNPDTIDIILDGESLD